MAWARFGYAGPGDDLPIDQWMDDQNNYVAQRDSLDATGREAWDSSTRSGDNLQANRPSDVVALGNAASEPDRVSDSADGDSVEDDVGLQADSRTDFSPPAPQAPPPRYVRAAPGDSISRLIGTSDPDALARFQEINGMDGRSSTIYSGRVYAIPNGLGEVPRANPVPVGSHLPQSAGSRRETSPARATTSSSYMAISQPTAQPVPGWKRALRTVARGTELGLAETGGVVAGGLDVGTDLLRTAELGHRAMDPMDILHFPDGTSALNQVLSTDAAIARYGLDRLSHPGRIVDDVKDVTHRTLVGLIPARQPTGSGPNPTFHQYFSAGRNQGHLGADASLALMGPLGELGLDGVIPYETNVLKFRGQGFNQGQAEHLALPYPHWGHHVAARRFGLPDFITENPLLQLKPRGISRGDFYQLHFENDPKFFGTRFPKDVGGSWRGKTDLKLQKNGPIGQFWNGTPSSFKSVVGSGIAANDAAWRH